MYQVMDDLINNFSTFLLGTVNEPYKVVSKYEHNIYSRSLDTKPDQYTHPQNFFQNLVYGLKDMSHYLLFLH